MSMSLRKTLAEIIGRLGAGVTVNHLSRGLRTAAVMTLAALALVFLSPAPSKAFLDRGTQQRWANVLQNLKPRAKAATTGVVWSTRLTVDRDSGVGVLGCDSTRTAMANCSSAMADDDFTFGGAVYKIMKFYYQPSVGSLFVQMNRDIPSSLRSALTLHVGTASFALNASGNVLNQNLNFRMSHPGWSDGTTVSLGLSTPVTGLSATAGNGQVTLTWNNPNYHGGTRDYHWEYQRDYSGWQPVEEQCDHCPVYRGRLVSQTVTGLQNGQGYTFQVRARGQIAASARVTVTPRSSIAAVRVTPGVASLTVDWTPPAGYWNAGMWGGYTVQVKSDGGSYVTPPRRTEQGICQYVPQPCYPASNEVHLPHTATSHTIHGLAPGKQYTVRILYGSVGSGNADTPRAGTGWRYRRSYWHDRNRNKSVEHGEYGVTKSTGHILGEVTATPLSGQKQQSQTPGIALPPPMVMAAGVNGAEMQFRFDAGLDESSVPAGSAFTVTVAGNARAVSGVAISGHIMLLKLASAVSYGELVTVSYTPPSTKKLRVEGGGAAVAAFSDLSVVNETPLSQGHSEGPRVSSAQVNGAVLELTFLGPLDESSVPATSAFSVKVAGDTRDVSAVSVSRATVTLTLASAVSWGESVAVTYVPPSTKQLRALGPHGLGFVKMFSGRNVTNNTPEPALTASVASAPAAHKGKGRFAVQIAFSDAVAGKIKAVQPTIQVTGGTLKRVKRAGGADRWALHIAPSSNGPVTVTLPATTDCAAVGAICSAAGRKLATAFTHTVPGPAGLSVADASVQEGAGATVDFAVTLSRAASGPVTVRYRTKNGTAKAGKDYTGMKGTLTFAAGETAKTVSVPVLDDAHDEGTETFQLLLSKAKGAAIADGEAVGTITNADPLQKDWLARFGRAAASDAVAAVTVRLETPRGAGSHFTLGGHRLSLDGSGGDLPPASAGGPGGADWLSWSGEPSGGRSRTMTGRELLLGTSFRAVLGSGAGAQWTGWGQGASVSQFSSAGPGLSLSGETVTGAMGMDYERGRLLTGFAMTHSLGEGTAHGAGRSYVMGSTVTTMLPYARLRLTDRVSAWGLAGTGSGRLTLDLDGADAERYGADLSMTLAAMGVKGDLVTPAEAGGFALSLKADAFLGADGVGVGLVAWRGEPRGGAGRCEPAAGGSGRLAQPSRWRAARR